MNPPSPPFTLEERLASVKVAAFSGVTATAIVLTLTGFHHWLKIPSIAVPVSGAWKAQLTYLAVAGLSGALFGLVYRYTVRRDRNSQLGAGVVGAFGLVRGLAQLEVAIHQPLWQLALAVGESLLLFAIVARLLQFAMDLGWLQSFGAVSEALPPNGTVSTIPDSPAPRAK